MITSKNSEKEKNLTQQQLADKLYVSRQTVCRWEKGSRCPDLITAKKLALELDVSVDELISDEDVKDLQVNYGIWKSERIKDKKHLQVLPKKDIRLYTNCGAVVFSNHDFATSTIRYESACMVYNRLLYYCSRSISL